MGFVVGVFLVLVLACLALLASGYKQTDKDEHSDI